MFVVDGIEGKTQKKYDTIKMLGVYYREKSGLHYRIQWVLSDICSV